MARTGPTNLLKRKLIKGLKKLSKDEQANIWERISEELSAPRRKMVEANISKINRNANEGEVVVVPGKVLGSGKLTKKIVIIAESYSMKAYEKLKKSGAEIYLLDDLLRNKELKDKIDSLPKRIIV